MKYFTSPSATLLAIFLPSYVAATAISSVSNPSALLPTPGITKGTGSVQDIAYCAFTAYSGDTCDGGTGETMTLAISDTYCVDTYGRHSYAAGPLGPGNALSIDYYPEANCNGRITGGNFVRYPQCFNVNTGGPWLSAKMTCGVA
jgi:hypothetical protein